MQNGSPIKLDRRLLHTFNGIDGATGKYWQSPLSCREVADLARREPRWERALVRQREKGLGEGIDPRDLGQTGWGVIFAGAKEPAVAEALAPLLALRRAQAGRVREARYRELEYRPGDSKTSFLSRHGAVPGPVQPDSIPYYLLLVGDPEQIPFELQYQLDIPYALGRIHFETPEEYARYAESVVAAEGGEVRRQPAATFFAPRNDPQTQASCDNLAAPLAKLFADLLPRWSVRTSLGDDATKAALGAILEGAEAPALLFTAGHGIAYRAFDKRQPSLQGSLLCQDWPGPDRPLAESHYFSAYDIAGSAQAAGLVSFHFSCFGAGTPSRDDFALPGQASRYNAQKSFLSRLPTRLLAHPGGGALAVVGHIDQAWGWLYTDLEGHAPVLSPVFENTLKRLAVGYPLGHAMEFFNLCYTELASDTAEESCRDRPDRDEHLARLWTNRNDARNYVVLGDPAVRLAVAPEDWLR